MYKFQGQCHITYYIYLHIVAKRSVNNSLNFKPNGALGSQVHKTTSPTIVVSEKDQS